MTTTRRQLLRHGVAAGLAVPSLGSILAACGGGADAEATGDVTFLVYEVAWGKTPQEQSDKWATAVEGRSFELREVPFEEVDRLVRLSGQQPNPPDVMLVSGGNIATYVSQGLLSPLADTFSDDYIDSLSQSARISLIGDDYYGPSTNDASQAMYFNSAVAERYGIRVPTTLDAAWTWDQTLEAFREVQAGERKRRGTDRYWAVYMGSFGEPGGGYLTGGTLPRSAGAVDSNAHRGISEDGLTADGYVNDPEALEGLEILQALYSEDLAPTSATPDFFANDQVAFWLGYQDYTGSIEAAPKPVEWGVSPFPHIQTQLVQVGGDHFCVSANAGDPEAAASFVEYMGSDSAQVAWANQVSGFSGNTTLIDRFPEFDRLPLKIFADSSREWGVPPVRTPGYSEYLQVYNDMLASIVGGTTVQEAADKAAADIDAQLEKYEALPT